MSKQGACGDCSCSRLSWCLHSRTASGEKKKYNYVYGNGGKLLKINPIPFLGRNMVAWSWSICWCYVITNSDFFLPWSWRWCKTRHIIHCVLFLIPVSFLFNTGRAWNLFSKTLMLKTNALNFFYTKWMFIIYHKTITKFVFLPMTDSFPCGLSDFRPPFQVAVLWCVWIDRLVVPHVFVVTLLTIKAFWCHHMSCALQHQVWV